MSSRPLALAILWHMHQPFYQDLVTGEYVLPWVRLHAVKDYYDMVALLDRFPEVRLTFNLVPSLMAQVEDYVQNKVTDKFLTLTQLDPAALSLDDRVFILQNFFMANWETMIHPYQRYRDLLLKRGRFVAPAELVRVAQRFSPQELMDLQVWYNLTWFGFISKNEDPLIKELIAKGKYFSAEDKKLVIAKQFEVMGKVLPKYKELAARGQIELTTTPFYHPILPLLCDTNCAREAMPYAKLPPVAFQHPEDAVTQIRQAVEFHEQHFGVKPQGMWPAEGSVSEQVIPLVAAAGIRWLATDEGILENSIRKNELQHRTLSAAELYQPYLIEREGAQVAMVFRNHFISDQVGFVYHRWKVQDSLNDFASHLNNIKVSLPADGRQYLLSVILDGENAWEYYAGGGRDFLTAFYQHLAQNPQIQTVKVSDYLQANPPQKKLTKLFAGSWINNNFKIWIGHEEDNLAWEYLRNARLALESAGPDQPTAWRELYIAEGSDWCWWYGDDHSSGNDAVFDALYRKHLKNIYSLIGRTPPKYLDTPLKKFGVVRPIKEPVYLIQPVLDGQVTNFYEWLSAGHFDIGRARGAMHQIETLVRDIYYGFSRRELFVRLDINFPVANGELRSFSFALQSLAPTEKKAEILYDETTQRYRFKLYRLNDKHDWEEEKELNSFGLGKILELAVQFSELSAKPGQRVEFVLVVYKEGQEVERWPKGGGLVVTVPTDNYEEEQWSV